MSEFNHQETMMAKQLLLTFALNGFQKTSMQDLARSAGLSRQSMYKKFGTKEQCYQSVINIYLDNMYCQIFQILADESLAPHQGLMKVFDVFVGNAVEVISNAHGSKVLDDTLKATHSSTQDWPLRFRTRLANYLIQHKLATSENALGVAYTLISAGKGLLVEESSRDSFTKNMAFIINSITKANL